MIRTISFLLAIAASVITALGQAPSTKQTQQDDRVIVGTNLVTVNVIVTDSKGRYVQGLSQDQFSVYDDSINQKIAHFSTGAAPVSFGIVCEIHENAPEQTRAVLTAIKQFTRTLGVEDDFFFVAFSEHGSVTTEFIPSSNQVVDQLQFVKPGGPSSLYDAVYFAANRLRNARNLKKALLLISDGHDINSLHSYNKLRDRLRTLDAQIYAIGIADPALDQSAGYPRWFFDDITRGSGRRSSLQVSPEIARGWAVLAEMSSANGGTTYLPATESESELAYICSQVALELRQQYTLAFYSKATVNEGWHKLKVRLREPQTYSQLRLSYRKGYQLSRVQ